MVPNVKWHYPFNPKVINLGVATKKSSDVTKKPSDVIVKETSNAVNIDD